MATERRKTRHLTQAFKDYNVDQLSKVTGLQLDEVQAWTIFKLCHKLPLRFLMTLDPEDFDGRNERGISLPGIGKFKYRLTVAQGKKKNTLEGGLYPRYKMYPAAAIEAEVEYLHGIADEQSKADYERIIKSEERHVERTAKEIARMISKMVAANPAEDSVVKEKSIQEMIVDLISSEVKREVAKEKKNLLEEMRLEADDNEEIAEIDEPDEDEENEVDEEDDEEDVKPEIDTAAELKEEVKEEVKETPKASKGGSKGKSKAKNTAKTSGDVKVEETSEPIKKDVIDVDFDFGR